MYYVVYCMLSFLTLLVMEQMYLIEIFIDKVTIFTGENDNDGADKKLIIKIKFGPKVEFIIKEGQLAVNDGNKDDIVECDENGRRKWSRTIRVGKSYLFPSYPDTVLMILSKFPLEIEVWNDDKKENDIFVGIGKMIWDTQFFFMLKDTSEACKIHEPLSIKQNTPLFADCNCKQVGEIDFILRISALGESIITEFQQLMKDPDSFVFRTNKAPSMFQCKRVEGDDPNFCMAGSLYETTTLEDPTIVDKAQQKIEICTELQSCGIEKQGIDYKRLRDDNEPEVKEKKLYPIDKIRMGDITGPCGNVKCPLAHKIKTYIRNLDTYKTEASGKLSENQVKVKPRKVCGGCVCKDDRWHRENCLMNDAQMKPVQNKAICSGCGGITHAGETCEDQEKKKYGTGVTPKTSKMQVNYVLSVTRLNNFKEPFFGKQHLLEKIIYLTDTSLDDNGAYAGVRSSCILLQADNYNKERICIPTKTRSAHDFKEPTIYNFKVSESQLNINVFNCMEMPNDKDCKCSPPKPSPPCKTFDCDCIQETANTIARKVHKPYCPSYKHKDNCPVTMMNEEEEAKKAEDDENDVEPLPYGLPPIKLGPCPVLGRPCTLPDGFARMYKTATLPVQPPSYSDAGKVCCSKEFERIKKAIKDYMKYEKDNDLRCVNKFNVDTERRCCDKEQRLFSLMGRGCCGAHKLAIQEKFKEEKKNS